MKNDTNLLSALRPIVAEQDATAIALTISALIDGLWVRLGIGDTSIDHDTALDLAYRLLQNALPAAVLEPRAFKT